MPCPGDDILFDAPLRLEAPLAQLWEEAEPFSPPLSPLDEDKRLHKPTGLLLSELVRTDFDDCKNPAEAQAVIERAQAHFGLLQNFGLCIVSHTTELDPLAEFSEDIDGEEVVVGYRATKYVKNSSGLHEPVVAKNLAAEKIQEMIVNPLRRYIQYCVHMGPGEVLYDVFELDQYSWQRDSGILFLHDTDPYMNVNALTMEKLDDLDWAYEGLGTDRL